MGKVLTSDARGFATWQKPDADATNLGGRPADDYALKTDIPTASEGGDTSNADTLDGFDSTSFAKEIDVADKVSKGGDEMQGDLTFNNFAGVNFPGFTRQAIEFTGPTYGLGVQSGVMYQRSDSDFAWFTGGSHSNTPNNPGGSGSLAMRLDSSGKLHPNSIRIEPEERAQALVVKGRRAGFFDESVAYFENTPSGIAANRFAGPAVRIVTREGQSQDGVLSVSNEGFGGYIARFGNSSSFVTSIDQQGNISTDGDVTANGNVTASGNGNIGNDLTVGNDLQVGGVVRSDNMPSLAWRQEKKNIGSRVELTNGRIRRLGTIPFNVAAPGYIYVNAWVNWIVVSALIGRTDCWVVLYDVSSGSKQELIRTGVTSAVTGSLTWVVQAPNVGTVTLEAWAEAPLGDTEEDLCTMTDHFFSAFYISQ